MGAVRVHTLVVEPGAEVEIHWQYPDLTPTLTRRYTAPPAIVAEHKRGFWSTCTPATPCCARRDEYNGYGSGPTSFQCPNRCACHD